MIDSRRLLPARRAVITPPCSPGESHRLQRLHLGLVTLELLVDGYPDFGVDVPSVDYSAIAAAIGFHSVRVEEPSELRDALTAAFAHDGPALVDIVTDPFALSLPPTISRGQVTGFGLAMSKIVLNGGVGEAVKVARSNIRHISPL